MRALALLTALVLFSFPAAAESSVQTAETYLNSITTMKARFVQTANDGQQVTGDFFLKRPGKMRFQYDAPITDFIVSDGLFIYYYDGQLKEQKNAPLGQSLADFFLRQDLRLSGDIQVTDVKRGGGLLQITLVQAKDPQAGALTLGFTEKPFALKKWRILDPQGMITEVELSNVQTGIKLDNDLFHYYDPERRKPGYN